MMEHCITSHLVGAKEKEEKTEANNFLGLKLRPESKKARSGHFLKGALKHLYHLEPHSIALQLFDMP